MWVERLGPERDKLVEAARFLAENGEEEAAADLAASVWRLSILSAPISNSIRTRGLADRQ